MTNPLLAVYCYMQITYVKHILSSCPQCLHFDGLYLNIFLLNRNINNKMKKSKKIFHFFNQNEVQYLKKKAATAETENKL